MANGVVHLLATPVGRFRVIAFIEGVSYLVLLLIAMPIKYVPAFGENPAPTKIIGAIHGGLFVLYGVAGVLAMVARKWPMKEAVRGFVVSIVPGGTFLYDAAFLKGEYEKERSEKASKPASGYS